MRTNTMIIVICAALTLSMLLASCGGPGPDSISTSSPLSVPTDTSPLPTATVLVPEPSPAPLVFPTSQPGFATVTGVLDITTQSNRQGFSLYLGKVIETSDPDRQVVGLDKTVAPLAILNIDTGAFAFYDVPPGWYALEIDRPLLVPVLVDNPEEGGTLYLTIEADDNIDLGTLPVYIP